MNNMQLRSIGKILFGSEMFYLWDRYKAEQGDVAAQLNLGMILKVGFGVAQNYTEAFKWIKLAAEHGLAEAQFNLGILYENGYGVRANYEEAVEWYKLAAVHGHKSSREN